MSYSFRYQSGRSGKASVVRLWITLVTFLALMLGLPSSAAAEPRRFEGVIYAVEERELAFPVDGLIDEVTVIEGKEVQQGNVLIRLRSQAATLEADRRRLVWEDDTAVVTSDERLTIFSVQYQTLNELFKTTGSVSKDELNALLLEKIQARGQHENSRVQEALAGLEYRLAAQQLEDRSLKAPIAGFVTKIEKFSGEWVSAGETVATMVDLSSVIVRTSVPDSLARILILNTEVSVNIDGVGESPGKVEFVSPVADPASGLVGIRITIANPDGVIRPGTRGRVLL